MKRAAKPGGRAAWLRAVLPVSACLGVAAAAAAQDWPQWRGPGRDGIASAPAAAVEWPDRLQRVWRVHVGVGHSSPVVVGDRVFQHARQGEIEQVASYDLAGGLRLWLSAYPAPYEMNPAARSHGKGPKSTPLAADGRVYALGIGGVLSCLDAAGGELVWRRGFEDEFRETAPLYGTATSPLLDGDRLIVHLGGPGQGALLALDAASGEQRWAWRGDGPGYASPVLAELDGQRQVIAQTERKLVGLALDDGRLLWERPFATPYDQNSVTPLVVGGVLVYSGFEAGISAVRPRREAAGWALESVWHVDEASLYMSSPVSVGGALYGFSHLKRGQLFALDLATGTLLWTGPGRQGENAALVATPAGLLVLTDGAELVVVRPDLAGLEPLASYAVSETATWAHPVPVPGGVLIKDLDSLALWRLR